MDEILNRLYACAAEWQTRRTDRSLTECITKTREECDEAIAARTFIEFLDEVGDVLVTALRTLHRMAPRERELVCALMEMKVAQRIDGGVKDKDAEAKLTEELAAKWGVV